MNAGHILAVDDEPHILDLYKEELEADGYSVSASDGNGDVIALVRKKKPDVVILDICLADNRSGLDILQALKRLYPDLPVILATAHAVFQNDFKAVAADHYIIKSIDLAELKDKINQCLR